MVKYIFTILVLTVLAVFVHSSENPYIGKIKLAKSGSIVQIRPLSEQPKVANIKNSIIQLVVITQKQSCFDLDKQKFQRNLDESPVFAVINFDEKAVLTCGIMNKLAKIKAAGGYGFILVFNDQTFAKNHCRMFDDNKFFMGVMDTDNFKILQKEISDLKEKKLYGKLTISLKDTALKLLEFWGSSLNRESYEQAILLSHLFEKFPSIKENVKWRPRTAFLGCNHGDNFNICTQQNYVASCACRGEFCSPELHKRVPNVLVRQDIRQMMIFKTYQTKYFQYMSTFLESCFQIYTKENYIEDCANSVMMRIGIDSSTITKQIDDLTTKCAGDPIPEDYIKNSQLYQDMQVQKRAFANYGRYPLVLINKQIIDYKSQDNLAGQLCQKLQLEDDSCYEVTKTTLVQNVISNIFYILIVSILLAVGGVVVYCYRKKLKKDMSKEIKMQVSTAVDHYYALAQVK